MRLEKMQKLQEQGINPYPARSKRTHTCGQIIENFDELEGQSAYVAGRIRSIRKQGQLTFMDLEDETGKIQLFVRKDEIGEEEYERIRLYDEGDFLQSNGEIVKTRTGQISIMVAGLKILTKSLRPLPDEYYGLKDDEIRLRKRYLDFILNPKVREMFRKKSVFWNSMRRFLQDEGFLEVETPVLEATAGGADATPFITHHNALDLDVYLRISMGELWQKRLMVGGFDRTFEIGRQFRNEGMSKEHLQDYTQMEFYMAYANYEDGMALVEEMYKHVIRETFGTMQFEVFGHRVDFDQEWERVDFVEAINERFGIDVMNSTEEDLRKVLDANHIDYDESDKFGRLADTLWKECRKEIAGPAFLVGHPVEVSPLAKREPENPRTVQRFQVLLAGSEMGNGYSELNDPIDQAERFEVQAKMREAGDTEAQMHDYDFVEALEYGMPPTCGFGVSERLFSFLMDKPIRECVMFPLMRPETTDEKVEVVAEHPIVEKTVSEEAGESVAVTQEGPAEQRPQDFSKKMVIVVNREIENWQQDNTIGHISAYLGNRLGSDFNVVENFITKDGVEIPRNTQYPIIALSAKPGQMMNLLNRVRESGLEYLAYTKEMIDTTNDAEIQEIYDEKESGELELLGVGFFGKNEDVDALTKKFSLLK